VSVSHLTPSKFKPRGALLDSSEMGRRVGAFDWSTTPLGPLSSWPQSLKTAVAICLRSQFQMAIYWGPELNCIYNDAERDVLGKLHPGALGQPARELLRDSWHVVGPQLEAVIEPGDSTWAEDQPLTFDRRGALETSYFTYSYSPILDDDGSVGGVLLVTQDTTLRVLAERRIDAVRELIARSLDTPTAREACTQSCRALTLGDDCPFALIYLLESRTATCMAGRAAGRATPVARRVVELDDCANDVSRLFHGLAGTSSQGTVVPASLFVAGGSARRGLPRRAFAVPIARGGHDPVDGFLVVGIPDDLVFDPAYATFVEMAAVAVGRSVAAARVREAERQRVSDIAELDQAKTDLFGNASHELRTPLALIIGHLDQLREDGGLTDSSRAAVEVAQRSAVRMLKLINAMLDFSRLEVGQGIGEFRETDVPRLTAETAAMFRSAVQRAGLRLVVDCPALPELVCVDPDAWERIVSNLISNALKFTPAGEIRIRTRSEGSELWLTIEDTGIGIARPDLERIFSRFYRVQDRTVRAHEGSGIGLALVRELVHLHRGSIEAESPGRRGTRMTVRVPLTSDRCQDRRPDGRKPAFDPQRSTRLFVTEAEGWFDSPSPVPGPGARNGHESDASADGGGGEAARVLVVEDSRDMRAYLRRLLAPHYVVELARNGSEARERALLDPPSLVISDLMMPDLDGFDLIQELRKSGPTSHLPIILLSARADPDSALHALELGADDYIVKPFGASELLARVQATLRNARGRSDAAVAQGRVQERAHHEGELRALLHDLRAAQRRVAVAGDAERRRIERDLHDGAQQRLMALRLELGLLQERVGDDPNRATEMLTGLRLDLDEALEELRELAHGLYPPLLASDGLEAALAATARRSAIPVTIEASGMTRVPRSIESTAYFCCLEALQNAAKHAGPGARAAIELRMEDGFLSFSVSDDGAGFDPGVRRPGYGLINLRDRLNGLGGDASVTSSPGTGTTVTGHIPLP
jgi:signal transduction histidine kinase/DNA-binding response OmpR family regulator